MLVKLLSAEMLIDVTVGF